MHCATVRPGHKLRIHFVTDLCTDTGCVEYSSHSSSNSRTASIHTMCHVFVSVGAFNQFSVRSHKILHLVDLFRAALKRHYELSNKLVQLY